MRENFKISALVAAFFAMLALVSCSKTGPAAEEYAEEERKFTILTEDDLEVLQEAYQAHFMILKQLENTSITTRTQLYTICGETKDQFDAVMSVLTHHNFIRWRMDKIIPSEKLRIGLARIDKTIEVDVTNCKTADESTKEVCKYIKETYAII